MLVRSICLSLLCTISIAAYAEHHPTNQTSDDGGLFESLGKKMDKAADSLGEQLDEAGTTTKILAKYSIDRHLGPFKIQVYTTDDKVTLVGTVENSAQFEKAVFIAASVKDVEFVDASRLKVKKPEQALPDAYLSALIKASMVRARIFEKNDPITWPVKINVKDNSVTLSGQLHSPAMKERINEVLDTFDGIDSIEDNIQIVPISNKAKDKSK